MTPKEKERYFRMTYNYWLDWKTKPENMDSSMEKLGCYVNLYSMLENRLRILHWEISWNQGNPRAIKVDEHGRVTAHKQIKNPKYREMTPKEYKQLIDDPQCELGKTYTIGTILQNVKRHLSSANGKEVQRVVDFRGKVLHKTMFKHNIITEKDLDDIMSCFRKVDARLKSLRRMYARNRKRIIEQEQKEKEAIMEQEQKEKATIKKWTKR